MDAITQVPLPLNESVNDYAPGSPERVRLIHELDTLAAGTGPPPAPPTTWSSRTGTRV